MTARRKAIVVGAGVAGLSTAVALRHSGWSVKVLEQQQELRTSGTAVVLHRAALRGLEAVGLGEEVAERAVPLTQLQIRTRRSVPLTSPKHATTSVLINRSALVALLRAALPEEALAFGQPLAPRDLSLAYEGADLVVAADGVNSDLRRALFGPRYAAVATGTTVWRGTARTTTTGLTEYWGQGRRFGVSARPGGGTNWYATAVLAPTRDASPQPAIEELKRLFGHWGGPVASTVESIDRESLLRHEIHHLAERLPRYYLGRTVLVGDAAHAMTPDLGRGANEAILDALVLARKLDVHGAVDSALVAYDRSRRLRTQLVAAGSAAIDALVHRVPPRRPTPLRLRTWSR